MRYRCFDFQESLAQSAELAIWYRNTGLYWRRGRRRKPAIRRYYVEEGQPETIGVYVMNRRYECHFVDKPLDGYAPLEAYLTEKALARLLSRVRAAGVPAACQFVEAALEAGKRLYIAVNRVKHLPDCFPEQIP